MPSYNQGDYIADSVQSVLNQSYNRLELIINDGGSDDKTVSILKHLSSQEPRLNWVSEADSGPAEAINKAFVRAGGEIIGWLNSDDLYRQGTIDKVVSAFNQNPDWIMCYGNGEHIDEHGKVIGVYPTQTPDVGLEGFHSGCFVCQPTVFFKTSMLTMIGNLDTSLKASFDYDFWMRAFKAFPGRIGFIGDVLAQSRLHQDCITKKFRATVALEGMALGQKHLGKVHLHWATTFLEELLVETNGDRVAFARRANDFLSKATGYITRQQLEQIKLSIQVVAGA